MEEDNRGAENCSTLVLQLRSHKQHVAKMAKTRGPGGNAGRGGCPSGAVTVRRSSRLATKSGQTPAGLNLSPSRVLSAANCSLSTAKHSCSPKQSTSPSSNSPTTSASPTRVS